MLMSAYVAGRRFVESGPAPAFANADRIIELERHLGLDVEASVNRFVAGRPAAAGIAAWAYRWLNWITVVVGLAVVWWRDRVRYLRLRDTLALSAVLGLVCHRLFPVAPPRLFTGFDDIVYGAVAGEPGRPPGGSNVYAAFPSYHVGWPAAVGLAAAATVPGRWRWSALAPALVLAVVVVATANHFVIDVVGGLAAVAACDAVVRWTRRSALWPGSDGGG